MPTAEFTPCVAELPEIVETKTGEEHEEVVFVHRARLSKFDKPEWKARGTGGLKLLPDRTDPSHVKFRIVMRRDQVISVFRFFMKSDTTQTTILGGSETRQCRYSLVGWNILKSWQLVRVERSGKVGPRTRQLDSSSHNPTLVIS